MTTQKDEKDLGAQSATADVTAGNVPQGQLPHDTTEFCGHCDRHVDIYYTTDDDVDLCEPCYRALREEMTVVELQELKQDIYSDIAEALRATHKPKHTELKLRAYEDAIGLIDVRISQLRLVKSTSQIDSGTDASEAEPADSTRRKS